MAIISTTATPLAERLALIAPVPSQDLWMTQIPRAEIIFRGSPSITLAGVGDTQRFQIHCILPTGYAYVYIEGRVSLRESVVGDLANWEDEACFLIQDDSAGSGWSYPMRMTKEAVGAICQGSITLREAVFEPSSPPLKKVIVAPPGLTPRLFFDVSNVSTNDAAMTSFFFFRFLQFDLNQAFFYAVNTPTSVR